MIVAKPLDLTKLQQVITRLRQSIDVYSKEPENVFYLDSVVKRFEYTFEVSRKILRRYLIDSDSQVAQIPVLELQRFVELGLQAGLLRGDWTVWSGLRHARNLTSHDYGEEKAREVAEAAVPMLEEATFLFEALRSKFPQEGEHGES